MKRAHLLLFLIVLAAFFLRFWRVVEIPPSLNWDEVSIGYNAYSILETGRDEWGEFMPLHFRSFGEYKLPAQIYASIPGIFVFGLNEFGLRITPVFYGTLTVFLLYFLAKKITKNTAVGLLSAFFLAVSPWHIQLTRASFESSFSVFWVALGLLLLVRGFEKPKYWILSALPFAIAVYTYNSARVFVPLFAAITFLVYRKEFLKFKKETLFTILFFGILLLPLVPFVLSGEAGARYKLVSITDEAGLVPRINERRGATNLPAPLPRLIHNKVTYVSFYFAKNYLAHFSPDFLFVSGAGHSQHHVQNIGQLYLIQAPFLIIGLLALRKTNNKFLALIVGWILLTFVPVAATQDSIPNALRTVIAAPAYQVLTALGIVFIAEKYKDKKSVLYTLFGIAAILFAFSFAKYINNLYYNYPIKYSRDWQYGNKQVVQLIKEHYNDYDLIVYTRHYGEPHIFTLFYLGWDPEMLQKDSQLVRYETHDWVWVENFDKFYFPNLSDKGTGYLDIVAQNSGKRILFIGRPGDFGNEKKLYEIDFLNGEPAFELIEVL